MTTEPASPVCYLTEAEDRYMGYAETDEIVAELNALLEAERAGTRVARATRRNGGDPKLDSFMSGIEKDEAHWCAMLTEQIVRLGGTPSEVCGAFYEKAMAIADVKERLHFLNRGQGWVVRKIEALTPKIRDDAIHAGLRVMAESHRANIAATDVFLESMSSSG